MTVIDLLKKKLWPPPFWRWLLVAAVILFAIGGWLLKPESPEMESLKTQLQEIIIDQTGEKNNMGTERIKEISLSSRSEGWEAELVLNADKGFAMISSKQTMWEHAIAILARLSAMDQLNDISISWIYPIEERQDDVKEISVMSFRFDKETRDQLIWENLEPSVLPDIALDYRQHPILNE